MNTTCTLTVEEIELAAKDGGGIPGPLRSPETLLFLQLRILYKEYRAGLISKDDARRDKIHILTEYGVVRQLYDMFANEMKLRNKISYELTLIEKNGCEQCRKLIKLFDGRIKE